MGRIAGILAGGFIAFLGPVASVHAAISISEIMYDLEGSDAKKEWIEIYNTGSEDINLADWRLFEADANHKLTPYPEGAPANIPPGGYAIIADDAGTFLANNSAYGGLLFDSSFSLSNTGETLILRDGALVDQDQVTYTSDWGATGDGGSLQEIESQWYAAIPTPGEANALVPIETGDSDAGSATGGEESSSDDESAVSHRIVRTLEVAVGSTKQTVTAGTETKLQAEVYGFEGEVIENARIHWTFGDGSTHEGNPAIHVYRYPGTYIAVVNGSSGEHNGTSRIAVTVLPAALSIGSIEPGQDGFIQVVNQSSHELDISGWGIQLGDKTFWLPPYSVIGPRSDIRIAASISGLAPQAGTAVNLTYPNGKVATSSVIGEVSKSVAVAEPIVAEVITQENISIRTVDAQTELDREKAELETVALVSDAADLDEAGEEKASELENSMSRVSEAIPLLASAVGTWQRGDIPLEETGTEEGRADNFWLFGLIPVMLVGSLGAAAALRFTEGDSTGAASSYIIVDHSDHEDSSK